MILEFFVITVTAVYVFFISWSNYHWNVSKDRSLTELKEKKIKVAVVVPVRNESKNLPFLLKSLSLQSYPFDNFEIIISDDQSEDNTVAVAKELFTELNLKNAICIKSHSTFKKKAIETAIEATNAELIITTDADVTVGPDWISSIVNEYSVSGDFLICGPVKLTGNNNYFQRLQSLEFAGLIGIGAAGINSGVPMFCNGANLAFSRDVFQEVNGYDKSLSASGDDTQLLLKIYKHHPEKISFLKDSRAIVSTGSKENKSELLRQRKRWASKIVRTLSPFTVVVAIIGWLTHGLMILQFFSSVFYSTVVLLFLSLAAKIISETIFLKSVNKFFAEKTPLWIVISAQPFYCIYIVSLGLLAPFTSFIWKGRTSR